MSDNQRRWFCKECKREWVEPRAYYMNSAPVSITGNPLNGRNCQTCGSPEIELIEFKPPLPGLDIPRDGSIKSIPTEILNVIPGTTTNRNFSIRTESPAPLVYPFVQVKPEEVQKEIQESTIDWTQLI
jgi:hypothetical protein